MSWSPLASSPPLPPCPSTPPGSAKVPGQKRGEALKMSDAILHGRRRQPPWPIHLLPPCSWLLHCVCMCVRGEPERRVLGDAGNPPAQGLVCRRSQGPSAHTNLGSLGPEDPPSFPSQRSLPLFPTGEVISLASRGGAEPVTSHSCTVSCPKSPEGRGDLAASLK